MSDLASPMSAAMSVSIGVGLSVNMCMCGYDVHLYRSRSDLQNDVECLLLSLPCQLDCLSAHQLISLCGCVLVCMYMGLT